MADHFTPRSYCSFVRVLLWCQKPLEGLKKVETCWDEWVFGLQRGNFTWNFVLQHTANKEHWNTCHKTVHLLIIVFHGQKRRRNCNCSSPCRALALTAVGLATLSWRGGKKSGQQAARGRVERLGLRRAVLFAGELTFWLLKPFNFLKNVHVYLDEANETWINRFLFCPLRCHQVRVCGNSILFVKRSFSWEANTWHFSVGFLEGFSIGGCEKLRDSWKFGKMIRFSQFPNCWSKKAEPGKSPNVSRRWTSQHVLGWPGWITQPGWDSVPCWPKNEWHHPGGHGDNPDET